MPFISPVAIYSGDIKQIHSSLGLRFRAAFILPRKEQMQMKLVLAEKPSVAQSIQDIAD